MSNYEGVLFKHENFHVIGPFRFPILKALLPAERRGMRDYEAAEAESGLGFMKLAKKIGVETGRTTKEVFAVLRAGNEEDDIVYDYALEIQELNNSSPDPLEKVSAFVTLFMQTRGEAQLNGPESEFIRTDEWQDINTNQIPMDMQDEIHQFILWERNGWPKEETEGNDRKSISKVTPGTLTKQS